MSSKIYNTDLSWLRFMRRTPFQSQHWEVSPVPGEPDVIGREKIVSITPVWIRKLKIKQGTACALKLALNLIRHRRWFRVLITKKQVPLIIDHPLKKKKKRENWGPEKRRRKCTLRGERMLYEKVGAALGEYLRDHGAYEKSFPSGNLVGML